MAPISDETAGVSLEEVAGRIWRSSNFRFSWQWFARDAQIEPSAIEAHRVLAEIVNSPPHHEFLRESFSDLYERNFRIEQPHEHSQFIEGTKDLEATLARACGNRLGAYSPMYTEPDLAYDEMVQRAFSSVSPFVAFQLQPGSVAGCPTCSEHGSHLFTNWFYGVAWDWCFCLFPRDRPFVWVGCLTDTD
jgi:hypothetical protein